MCRYCVRVRQQTVVCIFIRAIFRAREYNKGSVIVFVRNLFGAWLAWLQPSCQSICNNKLIKGMTLREPASQPGQPGPRRTGL